MHIPIVNHSLKYNPSLDGIRGIAITLVLLFHIWPKYFSFGYVGVDIFFVLSGFLITQIIVTKLQKSTFSFKEFYRNRVRRIFPSMIIVLSVTWLIGYLFLFPSELQQLGKHIKSSAFFYQNFRLIGETGYWDQSAQLKPLLHFWSLSIEEQFYLFWPLFLWISYRLTAQIKWVFLITSIILFMLPFLWDIDPFYHSFSRFWELSVGGLFYIWYANDTSQKLDFKWYILIVVFFILAIALSYQSTQFDPFKTLVMIVASGLIIYLATIKPNTPLLSNTFLVFLGLISFPLYLWHYMLISYMYIFGLDVTTYGFLIIIISILLAYLTYRYIELFARKQTSYPFALLLFFLVVLVGLLGQYTALKKGFPNRSFLKTSDRFAKQFIRTPATNEIGISLVSKILGHKPHNNYVKATSADISKDFIAIIGDSHAHSSYPGFAQEFKKRGYETVLLANSSCPPYIGGAMGKDLKDVAQCQEKIDDIYRFIETFQHLKKVILATRGTEYMNDIGYGVVDDGGKPLSYHFEDFFIHKTAYDQKEKFFQVVKNTLKYFEKRKDIDFYYLLENPELGFLPKNCVERPFQLFSTQCKLKYQDYIKRSGEYRNKLFAIKKEFPHLTILDPKDMYCDDSYCYAVKNGKMLYADDDHHSVDGSIMQAKYLMDKIIYDF